MKKIIGTILVFTLFYANVSAAGGGLLKTLNSMGLESNKDSGLSATPATVELPKGREILPAIWKYTHNEFTSTDAKVVAEGAWLNSINPFDNTYRMEYKIYFKFGMGIQSQESLLEITSTDGKLTVQTLSMMNYNCDKNLKHTNTGSESPIKSIEKNSENFAKTFLDILSGYSDDEYAKALDDTLYALDFQLIVGESAENTLKAKKWFQSHPLEGRELKIPIRFVSIDESKKSDYDYELSGFYGNQKELGAAANLLSAAMFESFAGGSSLAIVLNSNNDAYIDLKENTIIDIKGVVKKVDYEEVFRGGRKLYTIKRIYIDEK